MGAFCCTYIHVYCEVLEWLFSFPNENCSYCVLWIFSVICYQFWLLFFASLHVQLWNVHKLFLFAGILDMTSQVKPFPYSSGITCILGHNLVPTDGRKQKLCRYCRANEKKSPSGWKILTRSKCDICNVPLCQGGKTERNCFRLFHEEYVFGKQLKFP